MTMAITLRKFLADNGVAYDILSHPYTLSSKSTAMAAKVPANRIAKPVVLEDDYGYIMAVIPASGRLKISKLNHAVHRNLGLATEQELKDLFTDCATGAIPPLGEAYGITTVIDDGLDNNDDIYFEAGDHQELIHVKGSSFQRLMRNSKHAHIC